MTETEVVSEGAVSAADREGDPGSGRGRAHRPHRPGLGAWLGGHARRIMRSLGLAGGLSLAVAVLLPTIYLGWVAMHTPVTFDGAMNLQVADRLLDHGQYARAYDWVSNITPPGATESGPRMFPQEVETNGPYVLVASLGIGVFGHGQLGYQFSNLVFIALISASIWYMLRRWPVVAALAPVSILLALPQPYLNELGGIGEIPAISFAFVSFVFLGRAATARSDRTAVAYLSAAWFSAGLAITTKTYLLGVMPALVVGVAAVQAMRPVRWRPLITATAWVVVPQALFEIFRLVQLGSLRAYLSWWHVQGSAVVAQSGASTTNQGLIDKVRFQLGALLRTAGADRAGLLVVLLLMAACGAVGVRVLLQRRAEGRTTASPTAVHGICLAVMALTYAAWWAAYLPVPKEFVRRTYPALLPLGVLLVLLFCAFGTQLVRGLLANRTEKSTRPQLMWFGGLAALSLAMIVLNDRPIVDGVQSQIQGPSVSPAPATVRAYTTTADLIRKAPASYDFYGDGWWSDPVISLMAQRDLHNLQYANPCRMSPSKDIIIWDITAVAISQSAKPQDPRFTYTLYAKTPVATFFRISPAPNEHCAS